MMMHPALTFICGWLVVGLLVAAFMLLNGVIVVMKDGKPIKNSLEAFTFQLITVFLVVALWPYAVMKLVQARMR